VIAAIWSIVWESRMSDFVKDEIPRLTETRLFNYTSFRSNALSDVEFEFFWIGFSPVESWRGVLSIDSSSFTTPNFSVYFCSISAAYFCHIFSLSMRHLAMQSFAIGMVSPVILLSSTLTKSPLTNIPSPTISIPVEIFTKSPTTSWSILIFLRVASRTTEINSFSFSRQFSS